MTRILLTLLFVPLVSSAAAAADFAGKWTLNGDVMGNAVVLSCVVQQNAQAKLSGPCEVNGTDKAELAGELTDTALQFSIVVQGYTLNYTGKVEGETVSGSIEVAGASGSFSGQRAK